MRATPPPIVTAWPAWSEPFRHSPRGYLCRKETTWKLVVIFIGSVALVFSFSFVDAPIRLAAAFGVGVLTTLAVYVVRIRPTRSVIREARKQCDLWRQQWVTLESQSAELVETIRSRECLMDDAFDSAPAFPLVRFSLSRHLSKPLTDFSFNPTLPANAQQAFARQHLSRVLCELARLNEKAVMGRLDDLGVLAIYTLSQSCQYWVRVSYSSQGASLTPEVTIGVQTWSGPFTSGGEKYPGDLAKLRRHDAIVLICLPLLAIPFAGWVAALFMVGSAVRFLRRDTAAYLWDRGHFGAGDSADVYILTKEKQGIEKADEWTHFSSEFESRVEAMKGHLLHAVLRAFARQD